jgi:hypothetical protein
MRIFCTVVQIPARPVPEIGQDGAVRDAVAAQLVGDDPSPFVAQPLEQPFEEAGGFDGKQIVFSSVLVEADRRTQQLRGVLHGVRGTPCTAVTILSDGAEGPRSVGEAACVGPTCHVLDWFHPAMRIQYVAQAAKDWPDTTDEDRQDGARLADAVNHVRWRLWHGQVRRALNLIGDTLADLDAAAAAAGKVAGLLRALETYVVG